MARLLAFAFVFFFGGALSFVATCRWLFRRLNDPEVASEFMQRMWAKAHPHWGQVSEEDTTPVCPCCGWSPERAEEAALRGLEH